MSLTLIVGVPRIAEYIGGERSLIHASVMDGDRELARFMQSELSKPDLGACGRYRENIEKVQIAYTECAELEFLRFLPEVEEVWLQAPAIGSIDGLRHLPRLLRLSLDRPRYRFDVLSELQSLESVYLDDWRPGADGVFRLPRLKKLWTQKFPYADLTRLQNLVRLEDLWLNGGKLETLRGIPETLCRLRLTTQKHLSTLVGLGDCLLLEDLRLEACRGLTSLSGVENCRALKTFTMARCGPLKSVEAIRNLTSLRYLVLIEGTLDESTEDVDALYALRELDTLIVPKKSGLSLERLKNSAPACELRLVR